MGRASWARTGVADVYNAEISFTEPTYTAQCEAAQQDHAQAIFVADGST